MTARAALRAGMVELWRWPTVTALALATATTATLASRAAWVRAGQLLAALVGGGAPADRWTLVGQLAGVVLVGQATAALLVDVGRAAALSAYNGAPPPAGTRGALLGPLLLGLRRTPALICIRAVELLVYEALAVADLFIAARAHLGAQAGAAGPALLATALLFPSLALALALFAAARVAEVLVGRGLPPGLALVHGLDVLWRRLPSLTRLGVGGALVTSPLWAIGLLLPAPLRAAAWALATLWIYAGLGIFVGRDGRLATG